MDGATVNRRRFLSLLPAMPVVMLQHYGYEPAPQTEPTLQSISERLTTVEIVQSVQRMLIEHHADTIKAIQECVTGCYMILPEEMEL